jgi:hypothetical protein
MENRDELFRLCLMRFIEKHSYNDGLGYSGLNWIFTTQPLAATKMIKATKNIH